MADSLTYRGKPPYSQGNASDNELDRLVKMGVVDIQAPYRPDPMDPVTAGIGDGQFLPDSYSTRLSADRKLVASEGKTYQDSLGDPINMSAANSSKPYDEDVQPGNPLSGPVFPGGK